MKLFLDTNVLIDFISERRNEKKGIDYYADAATIMSLAFVKEIEVVVSALTIVNAMYICIESMKLPAEDVRDKLDGIRQYLGIVAIDSSDIYSSYDSDWEDFEDGVQYFSAKRAGCDYLVTRNEADFEKSDIPVLTPIQMTTLLYERRQREGFDNSDHS